ncbi:uncharacterized protein LOC125496544 [Beta vulgaris subsp. vulgaris]|uniref:uncharacterized protein LOC125496544 n=1 Tax=Beta vulgaris subsp. vulgaris TaxID=3555 RepID=UPI002549BF53|nr:uncharacterized protein LOC125496544 [Beta vulgaris subsp. vulgaris]
MDLFKKQKSSISSALSKQTKETMSAYRKRLEASIETIQWLLLQGLSFRGHDEKESSLRRGNFILLLTLLSKKDPEYSKVVFKNAPGNCQLTSPIVQKDIINACAKETTKAIIKDIDGGFFTILADESADVSDKEQMALCLRYVNKKGEVWERLLGIVHVSDTTSLTLKTAIESLLMEYSLSFSQVRGQGYDGASNMQGSINGLKTLIQNECKQAYFVHYFAHQLQLTQVALAKKNSNFAWLFADVLAPLLNFVGGSPKRKEFLREKQAQRIVEALSSGELETGSGLNQERGLGRPCDTRWGSHFKTILNVLDLYPSILGSLDDIAEVSDALDSNKAQTITNLLMSFDFVFVAHLMVGIFGITNNLNVALQKRDQDIVNAMRMVNVTKINLQEMKMKVGFSYGEDKLIHCKIEPKTQLEAFMCSFVYGSNDKKERITLWQSFIQLKTSIPWIVLGDYNVVLNMDERVGSRVRLHEVADFIECVEQCELADLEQCGRFFTWTNKQDVDRRVF